MAQKLSDVKGISEELAEKILNDYFYNTAQLAETGAAELAGKYTGVGLSTAQRIKKWAADDAAQQMQPAYNPADFGPEPPAAEAEYTPTDFDDTVPTASVRVQRIKDANA